MRAEQADVVGGAAAPLVFDDLNKMALLHNCMKEALRMHPPLIMLMRKAMRAVPIETDAGARYVIPKGDVVFAAPAIQGRLATCWTAPDAFDPDRYAPGREEHAMPFAHIGFGGGIHQCMGQQFGYCQVKTILSWLNRNYDMEIVSEFPEPDSTAMVVGPTRKPMVVRPQGAAAGGGGEMRRIPKNAPCTRRRALVPSRWCRGDSRCSIGIYNPQNPLPLGLWPLIYVTAYGRVFWPLALKTLVFAGRVVVSARQAGNAG